MKQYSQNKSSSAAVIVTIAAFALIGFSAIAIGRGGLDSYLHKRKQKQKVKPAAIDGQIEAIVAENTYLKQNMALFSTSLDKMAIQNEKLMKANNALTLSLEEEHDRVAKLMNIVTEESEEKLVLTQKLDAANNKLSMSEAESKVHIA